MTAYTFYGFYRNCEICNTEQPIAVGITHDNSSLRLIKYRCLRKLFTPSCIRKCPNNYRIEIMDSGLTWSIAYTLAERYRLDGVKVLTCSRT